MRGLKRGRKGEEERGREKEGGRRREGVHMMKQTLWVNKLEA